MSSKKDKKRKAVLPTTQEDKNDVVFVVTLSKENKYHDHDVLDVFTTKIAAMHSILLSDEMSEMCKELDVDHPLFQDYANYVLHDHTLQFIKDACGKLYDALIEYFQSKEKCFYWFHIAERIIHI
jgi:hypothetical protein